jgi:hypothetical protein
MCPLGHWSSSPSSVSMLRDSSRGSATRLLFPLRDVETRFARPQLAELLERSRLVPQVREFFF